MAKVKVKAKLRNDKATEKTAAAGDGNFGQQLKNVLLAGVGAVVLAQEEIEDFVSRLVQKGQMAEKDAKKVVKDVLAKRAAKVAKDVDRFEESVYTRIEQVMRGMNLVTRSDLSGLDSKISALSGRIDGLGATKAAAARRAAANPAAPQASAAPRKSRKSAAKTTEASA